MPAADAGVGAGAAGTDSEGACSRPSTVSAGPSPAPAPSRGTRAGAFGRLAPDPDPELAPRPGLGGGDVHGRLVRLQGDDGVVDRDLVAGGDVDLDDRHAGEVADVGQADLGRRAHGSSFTAAGGGRPRARCTAAARSGRRGGARSPGGGRTATPAASAWA